MRSANFSSTVVESASPTTSPMKRTLDTWTDAATLKSLCLTALPTQVYRVQGCRVLFGFVEVLNGSPYYHGAAHTNHAFHSVHLYLHSLVFHALVFF